MTYLVLGIYLLLLLFSATVYRKWSNPFVFFNLIWSIWLLIAIIGVDGVTPPREDVFAYFLLGGIVFNLAGFIFVLLDKVVHNQNSVRVRKDSQWYPVAAKVFTLLQVIILIYYVYKSFSLWGILTSGGSYERIRAYYYSDSYFKNTIEYLVVTYLFDPMVTLGEVVFAINVFQRKRGKFTLCVVAVNAVLRSVISGGRMIIFEFAALILVCFLYLYKGYIRRNRKNKRKVALLLVFAFFIATIITLGRFDTEKTLLKAGVGSLVSNFTGSFSYFSILDKYGLYLPAQHGKVIFGGIVDLFLLFAKTFGLTNMPYISNELGNITSEFYLIGDYSFNAMPTMYYFFMTDFGKAGIVLGCTLLALYCVYAYRRCERILTYKALAMYLLMMLVVIESSMTWLPFKSSFIMTILYAALFMSNQSLPSKK